MLAPLKQPRAPSDLANLQPLTNDSMREALITRAESGDCYATIGGTTLIAVRPTESNTPKGDDLDFLAANDHMDTSQPHLLNTLPLLVEQARLTSQPQLLVATGDTGAGKSYTSRSAVEWLTCLGCPDEPCHLDRKIVSFVKVMEYLGNAGTAHNEDSSRFSKMVNILFDAKVTKVVGAEIRTFCLEQTRLTSPPSGEKNFKILHALAAAAVATDAVNVYERLDRLNLNLKQNKFDILGQGDKCEDPTAMADILSCFEAVFSEQDIDKVLKTLAGILHLGNVLRGGLSASDLSARTLVEHPSLIIAGRLFDVPIARLAEVLSCEFLPGSRPRIRQEPTVAKSISARDRLMTALYTNVWRYIEATANVTLHPTQKQNHDFASIGILDICGFEDVLVNSTEQLYINTANELIQLKIRRKMFSSRHVSQPEEGYLWLTPSQTLNHLSLEDDPEHESNSERLVALRKIIKRLNDGCSARTDDTLHEKDVHLAMSILNDEPAHLPFPLARVQHYARPVTYHVEGMIAKNRTASNVDMSDLVQTILLLLSKSCPGWSPSSPTAHSPQVFLQELTKMYKVLETAKVNYVRCIRLTVKNEQKIDRKYVMEQLQGCGILRAVELIFKTWPRQCCYADFGEQFMGSTLSISRNQCESLLKGLISDPTGYHMGGDKVSMTEPVWNLLKEHQPLHLNREEQASPHPEPHPEHTDVFTPLSSPRPSSGASDMSLTSISESSEYDEESLPPLPRQQSPLHERRYRKSRESTGGLPATPRRSHLASHSNDVNKMNLLESENGRLRLELKSFQADRLVDLERLDQLKRQIKTLSENLDGSRDDLASSEDANRTARLEAQVLEKEKKEALSHVQRLKQENEAQSALHEEALAEVQSRVTTAERTLKKSQMDNAENCSRSDKASERLATDRGEWELWELVSFVMWADKAPRHLSPFHNRGSLFNPPRVAKRVWATKPKEWENLSQEISNNLAGHLTMEDASLRCPMAYLGLLRDLRDVKEFVSLYKAIKKGAVELYARITTESVVKHLENPEQSLPMLQGRLSQIKLDLKERSSFCSQDQIDLVFQEGNQEVLKLARKDRRNQGTKKLERLEELLHAARGP